MPHRPVAARGRSVYACLMPTKITVIYNNPTDPAAFEAGYAQGQVIALGGGDLGDAGSGPLGHGELSHDLNIGRTRVELKASFDRLAPGPPPFARHAVETPAAEWNPMRLNDPCLNFPEHPCKPGP